MQITVTIPDDFAAHVKALGLTPEGYVEKLIAEQTVVTASMAADTAARVASLEIFLKKMTAHSNKIPILPDEIFTRESFYQDHD